MMQTHFIIIFILKLLWPAFDVRPKTSCLVNVKQQIHTLSSFVFFFLVQKLYTLILPLRTFNDLYIVTKCMPLMDYTFHFEEHSLFNWCFAYSQPKERAMFVTDPSIHPGLYVGRRKTIHAHSMITNDSTTWNSCYKFFFLFYFMFFLIKATLIPIRNNRLSIYMIGFCRGTLTTGHEKKNHNCSQFSEVAPSDCDNKETKESL